MMRPYISAKFVRVQNHLINLEAIQQVELQKDGSAVITVPGPRKSLQRVEVPKPYGKELWEFFTENLVVIDLEPGAKPKRNAAKPNGKEASSSKSKAAPKKDTKKRKTSASASQGTQPASPA